LRVRKVLHSLGFRFRLHRKDLPGKPDIVLSKHRIAIFVHGCFWHYHACPYGRVKPATRSEFWETKRKGTVGRDAKNKADLEMLGWRTVVIWECETRSSDLLRMHLRDKMLA